MAARVASFFISTSILIGLICWLWGQTGHEVDFWAVVRGTIQIGFGIVSVFAAIFFLVSATIGDHEDVAAPNLAKRLIAFLVNIPNAIRNEP